MTTPAATHEVQSLIDDLHTKYASLDEGQVATYIPELAKADPDRFGVSLVTTTSVFSVVLALTFAGWFAVEKTLSIHTIDSPRREAFYWATVAATLSSALGR